MKIIRTDDWSFKDYLKDLVSVSSKAEMNSYVINIAKEICEDVIKRGDESIIEYTNKFDRVSIKSIDQIKVTKQEIEDAYKQVDSEIIDALENAAKRIELYHKKQMPIDIDYMDDIGVRLGNIWKPIKNVGIYVPGGTASYPSSVLMNAVPAKVAGVDNIIMVVPAPDGKISPTVLVAAKIAGVEKIYKIGGAQAIAALAVGTDSIAKVDLIVGPGNAYVAAAKRYFSGYVGIDMIAGPSEILIVSDNKNDPRWIAADLLSQAEHDVNARSILITDDEAYANLVANAVEEILNDLDRKEIARTSWENNGSIIVVSNLDNDTIALIDAIAPEHLELALEDDAAQKLVNSLNNAGAVFIGRYTPEAIGDYIAGPSHVLPTASTARFSSGLSVYDFLKRISLIGCSKESFSKLAHFTSVLAEEEGLGAHALSVRIRNNEE